MTRRWQRSEFQGRRLMAERSPSKLEQATLAGGCFWCMEQPFEVLDGVIDVVAGYTGGGTPDPTYQSVCSGQTGHLEAVQITFDPDRISFGEILDVFWRQIDPTDAGGSFVDRGSQYRSAIFCHSDDQKQIAEASKEALERSRRFTAPIATSILKLTRFFEAEAYHQDYHRKNPFHYQRYRAGSGRDAYIQSAWSDDPG